MIASSVGNKLNTIFQKAGTPTRRLEGDASWAGHDAARERDRFVSLAGDQAARDGRYDVASTHHPFAPPFRTKAQVAGSLENGVMSREDALFLDLPVRTEGSPTFLTTSETRFSAEGVLKLEAIEGPEGVTARRIFADYDEPSKNYVEEFLIAR